MADLKAKHEFIGDICVGLGFAAQMGTDSVTRKTASEFTNRVINAMRHKGMLQSKSGRYKNTLKVPKPMPFSIETNDLLFYMLDNLLRETQGRKT